MVICIFMLDLLCNNLVNFWNTVLLMSITGPIGNKQPQLVMLRLTHGLQHVACSCFLHFNRTLKLVLIIK